ncbi:MAG TPA: histidine phosphatase family protein [Candidatus Limnocylindrales bacterium]|nr:histidine phosphatase family protein [Candidatus Limnocylindrales bacterium]
MAESDAAAGPDGASPGIPAALDATLVLVRHGESELIVQRRFQGRAETPLSATGRRQAALVARRLARPLATPALPLPEGPPQAIVHSPLGRAAETAVAIEEAMAADDAFGRSIPRRPDDRLLEIGQGEWEGLLASDIEARDGERLATWRRRPTEAWAPGGERLTEVHARIRSALADLYADLAAAGRPASGASSPVAGYRDRPLDQPWTVVVGHDGVFKVLLLTLFDLPLDRFWMWSSDLCGISVIEIRAGRPVVRAMNLTEHLASLQDEAAQAEAEARTRSGAL